MTNYWTMRDCAFPNDNGPETDIQLLYCGGDTPHVWTTAEIDALDEKMYLPTWVRSDPGNYNGETEGNEFVNWLHANKVPNKITVVLDLETAIDAAYVNAFNNTLAKFSFYTMKYGSKDFIFSNPKTSGGTFVADPTQTPHMVTEGDTVATQYAFDGTYDLSWVSQTVKVWDKSGKGNPPPQNWTEKMINNLAEIAEGSTGQIVRNAQGLLNAHIGGLTIDGDFGPLTKSAVQRFQGAEHISVDGIIGQNTWTQLVTS